MYEEIRRAVLVKGISKREVAKIYGINRRTVDKMCKYSIPPGYKNKKGKKYPKIGDYKEKIDKILKEDLEIGVNKKVKVHHHRHAKVHNEGVIYFV